MYSGRDRLDCVGGIVVTIFSLFIVDYKYISYECFCKQELRMKNFSV